MRSLFEAKLDTRAQEAWLRRYHPLEVDKVLRKSSATGAKASLSVLRSKAPVGTAQRLSQYYRRMNLKHGTLRRSIRAAAIRNRGSAIRAGARTVGHVIGPIGSKAFTRHWVELGFTHVGGKHVPGSHWLEQNASIALNAAREASEAQLIEYGRG